MSSAFLTNVLKRHDLLMSNENLALTCHAVIASLSACRMSTLNILFDGWVREILWPRFAQLNTMPVSRVAYIITQY